MHFLCRFQEQALPESGVLTILHRIGFVIFWADKIILRPL
ncbi:MAG: hypothetical protein ACI8P3_003480 [Saprospiraceae bacterium]|jgi:hypothetical protein